MAPRPNGALREENVLLAAKIAELTIAVTRLETANAEIIAANRLLLDRVERFETLTVTPVPPAKTSSNSSKPPSTDTDFQRKMRDKKRASRRERSDRKPGKQRGAAGAYLPQVDDPDHPEIHRPDMCTGCGLDLDDTVIEAGTAARQVRDFPVPSVTPNRDLSL